MIVCGGPPYTEYLNGHQDTSNGTTEPEAAATTTQASTPANSHQADACMTSLLRRDYPARFIIHAATVLGARRIAYLLPVR